MSIHVCSNSNSNRLNLSFRCISKCSTVCVFNNIRKIQKYVPGKTMKICLRWSIKYSTALANTHVYRKWKFDAVGKIIPFYLLLSMLFEFNVIYSKERGYQCKKEAYLERFSALKKCTSHINRSHVESE